MAIAKSPVFSQIRGSIAGMTCLAGPSHQIVLRQKTSPVVVCSNRRQTTTGYLAHAAQAWKLAPQADRNGWNDYASPRTGYNSFIGAYAFACLLDTISPGYLKLNTMAPKEKGVLPFIANGFRPFSSGLGIVIFDIENQTDDYVWYQAKISFPISPTSRQNLSGWDNSKSLVRSLAPNLRDLQAFYGLLPDRKYQVSVRASAISTIVRPMRLSSRYEGMSTA